MRLERETDFLGQGNRREGGGGPGVRGGMEGQRLYRLDGRI